MKKSKAAGRLGKINKWWAEEGCSGSLSWRQNSSELWDVDGFTRKWLKKSAVDSPSCRDTSLQSAQRSSQKTPNSPRLMFKDRMETTTEAATEVKEGGDVCKTKKWGCSRWFKELCGKKVRGVVANENTDKFLIWLMNRFSRRGHHLFWFRSCIKKDFLFKVKKIFLLFMSSNLLLNWINNILKGSPSSTSAEETSTWHCPPPPPHWTS